MEEDSNPAHPIRGAATQDYTSPPSLESYSSEDFPDNYSDYFERDMGQLRATRLASGRTLVVIVAVLTQIVVLAFVAMIMGVAVLTMCAVIGELVVVTIVATALERRVVTVTDLTTMAEVTITFLVTFMTVALAAIGGTGKISDGASLTATKFA